VTAYEVTSETRRVLEEKSVLGGIGNSCLWFSDRIPAEPDLVFLGNNVVVASDVCFYNHDATAGMLNRKFGTDRYKLNKGKICIGDNAFIDGRSIILYHVRIGSNVIIGAGSVVASDVPDNSVVAGVPAKYIKSFDEFKSQLDEKCAEECIHERITR